MTITPTRHVRHLEDLAVCTDCMLWIAYADATGLSYYLDEDAADQRLADIQDGERDLLELAEGGQLVAGDSNEDEDFSTARCECCGTTDGGARHQAALLGYAYR